MPSRCFSNGDYDDLDFDREKGVIRSAEHAFSKDGGLAVLYGNLAESGAIAKTAGVDASILVFSGPAVVLESQDQGELRKSVRAGATSGMRPQAVIPSGPRQ